MNKRNSSVELLRIFCALGVIVLHYNNANIGGALEYVLPGSINEYYLRIIQTLCSASVNIFVIILGYYSYQKEQIKLEKIINLFIEVILLRVLCYGVQCIINNDLFSVRNLVLQLLPTNYFLILYSVLYLISPYINRFINILSERQLKNFLRLILFLFSFCAYFIDCIAMVLGDELFEMSTISLVGSSYGINIVTFILLYFIGAYFGCSKKTVALHTTIIRLIVCTICLFLLSKFGAGAFYYNNPLVIGISCELFLIMSRRVFYSRIINRLSRATFTCYIFHGYWLKFFDIKKAVHYNTVMLFFHQIFAVVSLFLASYIMFEIYNNTVSKLNQRILKKVGVRFAKYLQVEEIDE